MFDRIVHVFLSYITRPMIWAVGGVYLLALISVLGFSFRSSKHPAAQQQAYPEFSASGRTLQVSNAAAFAELQQKRLHLSVVNVEIRGPLLTTSKFEAGSQASVAEVSLRQLLSCSRLRTLSLYGDPGFNCEELMESLGKLRQLERLKLDSVAIQPMFWRQLGRLPRLRHLELNNCNLWGDYPDLELLLHLDTLVLNGFVENETSFLPGLSRLPRLKTLVLTNYLPVRNVQRAKGRDPAAVPISVDPLTENLSDLRAVATLKTLYVNEYLAPPHTIEQVMSDVPDVQVRPLFVDTHRQQSLFGVFALNLTLVLLLAMQLHSQFAQPAARMVPHYSPPHLFAAAAIAIVGVLLHCLPMSMNRVPFAAALGVNLLLLAVLCGILLLGNLSQAAPGRSRILMIPLAIIAACWVPLATMFLQWNRSSLDWYLRGNEPGWTALFVIFGILISVITLGHTRKTYLVYLERGISSPPLGLDPIALAAWQQGSDFQRSMERQKPGWIMRLVDWKLSRAITRSAREGSIRRSQLWIAGNQGNGSLVVLSALFLMVILVQSQFLLSTTSFEYDFRNLQDPLTLLFTILIPDVGVFGIANIWRSRSRLFGIESLRAVSRDQFSRQIARALAVELYPLAGIYLATLAWYVLQADPQRWSWAWTAAMLLVFVARWGVMYGILLWSITVRPNWLMFVAAIAACYAVIFANISVILLQAPVLGITKLPPDMPQIGVAALTVMALLYGLIACLVTGCAYRRWRQVELV